MLLHVRNLNCDPFVSERLLTSMIQAHGEACKNPGILGDIK
jgi:hypothetical protein